VNFLSLSFQRIAEELDGMEDLKAGQVADLHPAPFAIREDEIGIYPGDRLRQILPDLLGDGELLFLKTVQASQTAALSLDPTYIQPRDQTEQLQRRQADVEGAEVTGGEVGRLHRNGLEGCGRFSLLAEAQQVLANVEEASREFLRAGEMEEWAVLVAEHQAAARRGEDNVEPPNRFEQRIDIPPSHLLCPPEIPDAEARDPAAALGGDYDRQTVRLQDLHGGLSHVRLIRVRETAVEIGNLPATAFRRLPGAEPPAEGGILVRREGPPPVDPEQRVEEPPDNLFLHQRVDDLRVTGGHFAEEVAPDEEPIPEGPPPLVQVFSLRHQVQLGDRNAGGADRVAEAAARAEVDPVVHGGLGGRSETLRPRPCLLRSRETGRHPGDGAGGHAGCAPDADVREFCQRGRFFFFCHDASALFAARKPVAMSIPSRDFSSMAW
jgi:hypothetical protein